MHICFLKKQKKRRTLSLAWLIDEGLTLSKPVHKYWEKWLFLRLHREQTWARKSMNEKFSFKKANYAMEKNQKIHHKRRMSTIRQFR